MWQNNYYTAIVIVNRVIHPAGFYVPEGKKFRSIPKAKQQLFEDYIRKTFPEAHHINYYERADRSYVKRVYL